MAKKDMYNNLVINTFTSGGVIDLLGYESHTFAAIRSAAGAITFTVEESDDNQTFVKVEDSMILGALSAAGVKSAQIGYKGDCRYLKVVVSADGATLVHVAAAPHIAPVM